MDRTPSSSEPDITASLRAILRGILQVLGMWRVSPEVAVLMHRRINACFARIERLLQRFRAGRLWRVTDRVRGLARGRGKASRAPTHPRKFGWLVIAGGHQAAGFGAQLQSVLSAPEMSELLAASPQAVRIVRPLCRALAVEMPGVSGPPRKRLDGERPKRPRKPRPKPEPFKIPLPRGVLTWARRQGYGKRY